jgi:hypothetical protein
MDVKLTLALFALCFLPSAHAQSGVPDLQGIWNSTTATPLERPAALKDKEFYTVEEAAELERQAEVSPKFTKNRRTSIIYDPPDGRLPALTPEAAAEKKRRQAAFNDPASVQDLGQMDRCLIFPTSVPPMTPFAYNSNYQIIQTGQTVMIAAEMPHETRIIPLGNRPHLPPTVRLWLGDSVGHWEGKTLVVDTTNYNDGGGYYGTAGGMIGWDRNNHVVERFSLLDPDTLLYQFEVTDPTAFTKPWKGELTMSRGKGPMYEYACHEGNLAVPNLMKAFRSSKN